MSKYKTITLPNDQTALLLQYISNKVLEAETLAVGDMRGVFLLESRKLENLFNSIYEQVGKEIK